MSSYLLSVVATVLLCALLTAILPEGKTTNVVKGVTKLACLLTIIAPIPVFIKHYGKTDIEDTKGEIFQNNFIQSGIQQEETFIKYYSELRVQFAKDKLEEEIYEKFNRKTSVTIQWKYQENDVFDTYNEKEIFITQIKIKTVECSDMDKTRILEYVKKHYCSEVLIE